MSTSPPPPDSEVPPAPAEPTSTPGSPTPARWVRIGRYRLLWVLGLTVFILDQVTKYWIVQRMPLGTYYPSRGAIPVINGFFNLVHVGNTGAAWSLFTGRSTVLASLAVFTLAAIYFYRRALGLGDRTIQLSFGLLCGGIVGNLTDRLAYGHVVDFLDFHFGSYVYPTFNVADCGICIGVILYLFHNLRHPPEPPAPDARA